MIPRSITRSRVAEAQSVIFLTQQGRASLPCQALALFLTTSGLDIVLFSRLSLLIFLENKKDGA
jgi:hypothetical protein